LYVERAASGVSGHDGTAASAPDLLHTAAAAEIEYPVDDLKIVQAKPTQKGFKHVQAILPSVRRVP
tara:strand:- start:1520 stop:1717 length:198 start_codon:yes stop_codon:yes gene_type:complete